MGRPRNLTPEEKIERLHFDLMKCLLEQWLKRVQSADLTSQDLYRASICFPKIFASKETENELVPDLKETIDKILDKASK